MTVREGSGLGDEGNLPMESGVMGYRFIGNRAYPTGQQLAWSWCCPRNQLENAFCRSSTPPIAVIVFPGAVSEFRRNEIPPSPELVPVRSHARVVLMASVHLNTSMHSNISLGRGDSGKSCSRGKILTTHFP